MLKYKPQHTRLLFIDRKIGAAKYPNCASLAEEWEVSAKTIQRDLEYMRYQLDAPLQYSAKHRGFYYTEENFKLPAISIKESDLFAIYLAEELLVQYEGTPFYDSLSSVFKKIQESLPERDSFSLNPKDTRFTVFPPPTTTIRHDIWDIIFTGLKELKQIQLEYRTPGKTPTTRLFDPYHAIRYDGDWYIIGHCHTRNTILTFSFARIIKAKLQDTSFTIAGDFNFQQVTSSRFGLHWGEAEEHVKIWFSPAIAEYILERKWHASQKITRDYDGSITLELTVDHTMELKKWVLSWGKEAKVLEPESLLLEMEEEVNAMKTLYPSAKPG